MAWQGKARQGKAGRGFIFTMMCLTYMVIMFVLGVLLGIIITLITVYQMYQRHKLILLSHRD